MSTKNDQIERAAVIRYLRNECVILFEHFPEQSRVLARMANDIKARKHLEEAVASQPPKKGIKP